LLAKVVILHHNAEKNDLKKSEAVIIAVISVYVTHENEVLFIVEDIDIVFLHQDDLLIMKSLIVVIDAMKMIERTMIERITIQLKASGKQR
jgi:hypothetical protein